MTKYTAHFDPQAWIRDNAVSVDAEGPQTWDCTEFVTEQGMIGDIEDGIEDDGEFLDRDDILHRDPDAPEWVREWRGPFTITVTSSNEVK